MSTNRQKKRTKHVRVEIELHRHLKVAAANYGVTMSKLLGNICQHYFTEVEPKINTHLENLMGQTYEKEGVQTGQTGHSIENVDKENGQIAE